MNSNELLESLERLKNATQAKPLPVRVRIDMSTSNIRVVKVSESNGEVVIEAASERLNGIKS